MEALSSALQLAESHARGDEDLQITNLEAPTKRFIGRRQELEHLNQLMDRPDARLITLLGPGGVGKTRLAIQFGVMKPERFMGPACGGVWFADLSEVRTLDALLSVVSTAIRVPLCRWHFVRGKRDAVGTRARRARTAAAHP